jgi:hypothetical protein
MNDGDDILDKNVSKTTLVANTNDKVKKLVFPIIRG